MTKIIIAAIFTFLTFGCTQKANSENNSGDKSKVTNNIYDINVRGMDGKEISLSEYRGKVLLIVNVASECGYTPQYKGLQKIYEKYKDSGFEILAFPCNDFGGQEPGSNEDIKEFCSINYGVNFTLFDKITVLGDKKEPLYDRLINNPATEGGDIDWNFEKFLIARDGSIVKRFRSKAEPESEIMTSAIESELKK